MPISKIYHKGKEIIYTDCRDLNDDEMIGVGDDFVELIVKEGKQALCLFDFQDAADIAKSTTDLAREKYKEYGHLEKKGAVIGLSRIKRILLKFYNSFRKDKPLMPFDTKEEALDWLVE